MKSSSGRPGIPPPPLPGSPVTGRQYNGTSTDNGENDRPWSRGAPFSPNKSPSILSATDVETAHTSSIAKDDNKLNDSCNISRHGEVAFDVMTYTVDGKSLSGAMLGIEHRDPVEHGSEIKDQRKGVVWRRKPNGVYFRLMFVNGLEDQLKVGDEVLAVAGYQLADMSLETARYRTSHLKIVWN
jgi:hypothetical protein